MKILKYLLSFVFLLCCFSVIPDSCAADSTINWKGYTWGVYDGDPWGDGFGTFSSANVVGPDANGYLTLKITNPSGDDPVSAEIYNQTTGLGYGTYTSVTGSRMDTFDKNVMFSGMYLYYDGSPVIQFAPCLVSKWDGYSFSAVIDHDMAYGWGPDDPDWFTDEHSMPSDVVQTHRMIWEPGKVTMDSFLGEGTGGTNYFHTVITTNVPASSSEQVYFDLMTYADGYPQWNDWDVPATNLVLRDFSFVSYYAHALTVTNGTGDGTYASGANVTITADAPALGQVFDRWTGNTSYLASTTAATTTVTMPNQAMAVTATYKAAPVTTYSLTVTNGTGDGSYASGTGVTITADAPASGQVFDRWTGNTSYLASTTASTTTVTMPAQAIALAATYKTAPVSTYVLTVNSGTGSGSYSSGASVTVIANAPASGQVFDRWTGSTAYLSSTITATATVTMPSSAIAITATYKAAAATTYTLSVINGTGDGSYTSGTGVTITADSPASGQVFDKWTGDTTYLSSVYTSTATVTMPATVVILTATFKNATAVTYKLNVVSGSGSGYYTAGTNVSITANAAPAGKVFERWTGDINYILSSRSADTKVTIPERDVNFTAVYKNIITTYPDGTLIKVIGSSVIYVIVGGDKRWIPTIEAFEQMGYKWEDAILVSLETANAIADYKEDTTVTSYANGTLIKTPDSFKVYVIISGKKKWIPTPEVFEQLGYQWTSIVNITREKINFVPDFEDNLIRSIGNYKVYLVVNGVKRHIPNPNIFLDYGFKWEEVKDVPRATIDQYRDTYLIKQSRDNSIYYLAPQEIRKLIPTTEIFNSYNNKAADIQIVSKTEMDSYPLTNLIKLGGTNDIYLIEGTVKRRIPSAAIFDKYHLNWNYVMVVNQLEFNFYQTGAELK